jgi:hypothetical protein
MGVGGRTLQAAHSGLCSDSPPLLLDSAALPKSETEKQVGWQILLPNIRDTLQTASELRCASRPRDKEEWSMKPVIVAILISIALPGAAVAFENIEADVFYDGLLKDQIMKEFAITLAGLEKQAKELGVEPRQKDVDTAKRYFATKAMMMARCLDTGLSIKKTMIKDADVKKFNRGCVRLETDFMSWVEIGGKISDRCRAKSQLTAMKEEKPVYEFLKIENIGVATHYDVVTLRDCYLDENGLPETWAPKR